MSNVFKRAILTGRYQNFHAAHLNNIKIASRIATDVTVIIGSAQESGTERNPFSAELRKLVIEDAINQNIYTNVSVHTIPDFTNERDICHEWGDFLMDHIHAIMPTKPDLIVHGDDGRDNDPIHWFRESHLDKMSFLMVSRSAIAISATKMREYLIFNKIDEWKQYAAAGTERYFNILREQLILVPYYKKMLEERDVQ